MRHKIAAGGDARPRWWTPPAPLPVTTASDDGDLTEEFVFSGSATSCGPVTS